MRNPLRSEAEAYRFLLGTIVYFGLIVLAAMLFWPPLVVLIDGRVERVMLLFPRPDDPLMSARQRADR